MSSHWPARLRSLRPTWLLALAALIFAALTPLLQGAAAPQPLPTQRVDLKVLVVYAGAASGSSTGWQEALRREGVPFEARSANNVSDAVLANYGANRANYQAVIVTTGVGLPAGASSALAKFEATFGIRQITELGDSPPNSTAHGLGGAFQAGDQGTLPGPQGQLTPLGRQVFPYLNGPITIDTGAFGFQAAPGPAAQVFPGSFQPLVNSPNDDPFTAGTQFGAYLGIYTNPIDFREELVMTVSSNQFQLHNNLLRHGMLNWVTRGVYLGTQRNYFVMHIDDIFLPDAKWDAATNSTPGDASVPTCTLAGAPVTCPEVRMVPSDVRDAINWQNANGLRFEFLFNGQGRQDAVDTNAALPVPITGDPLSDDPVNGLFANKAQFGWMNHTFTHAQLDLVSVGTATGEINNNIGFATTNALPNFNPQEIVTGEHSGLGTYFGILAGRPDTNQNVVTAFNNTGIRWVGDDNSAKPNQRTIGNALTIPRYPSNVYYNVAARDDQLDEYNYIYLPSTYAPQPGVCVNTAVTTCRAAPALWLEYSTTEANIMFGHVMGNDPKPHYAHQSNLIVDGNGLGILYKRPGVAGDPGVLDVLLNKYKTYFNPNAPLVQPTFTESGQLLQKKAIWDGQVAQSRASGYLLNGQVHVVTSQAMEVPLNGTTVGDLYGGQRSGWTGVPAGDSVFAPSDPVNAIAPAVTGSPTQNSTLNAVTGSWVGTAPISLNYQWQRCNGPLCVNITGVVDANYKVGPIDAGFSLRVVQMAGNWISSVSQATSSALTVPGPPPAPGTLPPTGAGPGNLAGTLTKLTMTNIRVTPTRFKASRIKGKKLLYGTRISWRLNAVAKVTMAVQKKTFVKVGKKKRIKWVAVGFVQTDAKTGNTTYRFGGRIGGKVLKPGAYRFAISAKRTAKLKTTPKVIAFTFLKG